MSTDLLAPVQRDGDQLFTTSEAIAQGAGVQHKAILQNLDNHISRFEAFGRVDIRLEPFETAGGIQHRRIARLNEQQATLMLTFLRNTDQVLNFKVALVKAFYEMARQLNEARPAELTRSDLARMVLEAEEEKKALEAVVAEQAPKVAAWDSIVSSAGSWSYNDAAKVLCESGQIEIGEKRLVARLIEWGYLYRDHKKRPHVYQQYLAQGLFAVKARTYTDLKTGETRESSAPQVRITGKGLDMIRRRLTASTLEIAA